MSTVLAWALAVAGGFVLGSARWRRRADPPRATNVYAILPLTFCPYGSVSHEEPVPAEITYNEQTRMWWAGCGECGAGVWGDTPHDAARAWNGRIGRST